MPSKPSSSKMSPPPSNLNFEALARELKKNPISRERMRELLDEVGMLRRAGFLNPVGTSEPSQAGGSSTLSATPLPSKELVQFTSSLVKSYAELGIVNINVGWTQFKEDFGAGYQGLKDAFEMAWEMVHGEAATITEHAESVPPSLPAIADEELGSEEGANSLRATTSNEDSDLSYQNSEEFLALADDPDVAPLITSMILSSPECDRMLEEGLTKEDLIDMLSRITAPIPQTSLDSARRRKFPSLSSTSKSKTSSDSSEKPQNSSPSNSENARPPQGDRPMNLTPEEIDHVLADVRRLLPILSPEGKTRK